MSINKWKSQILNHEQVLKATIIASEKLRNYTFCLDTDNRRTLKPEVNCQEKHSLLIVKIVETISNVKVSKDMKNIIGKYESFKHLTSQFLFLLNIYYIGWINYRQKQQNQPATRNDCCNQNMEKHCQLRAVIIYKQQCIRYTYIRYVREAGIEAKQPSKYRTSAYRY